jgi:hypothetical protein
LRGGMGESFVFVMMMERLSKFFMQQNNNELSQQLPIKWDSLQGSVKHNFLAPLES